MMARSLFAMLTVALALGMQVRAEVDNCGADAVQQAVLNEVNALRADNGVAPVACRAGALVEATRWSETQCTDGLSNGDVAERCEDAGLAACAQLVGFLFPVGFNPETGSGFPVTRPLTQAELLTGGVAITRRSFEGGGRDIILGPRENLGVGYADCGDGRMFATHLFGF